MKQLTAILLLTSLFIPMNASELSSFLPMQAKEWSAKDSDRYYDNKTLYSYIDGAAELYISYGFDTVIGRRYTCSGEPDIAVEIYHMNAPRDAFGVFTNMREKNQQQYGQGSQLVDGSLIFWKDCYFISISFEKNTDKRIAAVTEIAKFIDKAIPGKGALPQIMSCLPAQDLIPEGFCYFHHYIWLNSFYQISNEDILNIDANTNAVLAKYGEQNRSYLLVVQYPDKDSAKIAFDKFIQGYSPELKSQDAVKQKNKTWCTATLQGNFIAAVFNAPEKKVALELIDKWKITSNNLKK
jgi:hypothetical protein